MRGGVVVLLASTSGAVAVAFAIAGIVSMRLRPIAGWSTLAAYSVVVLLHIVGVF